MSSIEQMLDDLSSVGRPRLSRRHDGTWYAVLEFPAPVGVTAQVDSDFGHKTHRGALETLIERLGGLRGVASTTEKLMIGEQTTR
jgi:hypothetical protein